MLRNVSYLSDTIVTISQQQARQRVYSQCELFEREYIKPEHCLHCLLPTGREQSVTDRLRSADKLPRIFQKLLFVISYSSLQCE